MNTFEQNSETCKVLKCSLYKDIRVLGPAADIKVDSIAQILSKEDVRMTCAPVVSRIHHGNDIEMDSIWFPLKSPPALSEGNVIYT